MTTFDDKTEELCLSLMKSAELTKKYGKVDKKNQKHFSDLMQKVCQMQSDANCVQNLINTCSSGTTLDDFEKAASKISKPSIKNSDKCKNLTTQIQQIFSPSEITTTQPIQYDDDIVMEEDILYMDPISKVRIEYPVKNKDCNHRYDKKTILESIQKNKRLRCPVAGCGNKQFITKNSLIDDLEFAIQMERRTQR